MIYVVGHKSPDTDSICSAIAYANLKRKLGVKNIKAARAGELNEQTKWVLDFFNEKPPIFLKDFYRRARDFMTKKVIYLNKKDPIKKAVVLIKRHNIRFIPIVENGKPIGILNLLNLARYIIEKFSIKKQKKSKLDNSLKISCYEICDKKINFCFEDSFEKEIEKKLLNSKSGGLVVLNKEGYLKGVITKTNLLKPRNDQLILVDHNEISQAIDGAEEAKILEVIDHHRLNAFTTLYPIHFVSEPIGSTCTIISFMYKRNKVKPRKKIAGLLLSGILSDTVGLTSKTTTEKDKEIVRWLTKVSNINSDSITKKFADITKAQGEAAFEKTSRELIEEDFKLFIIKDKRLGLGHVEVTKFDRFYEKKKEIEEELIKMKKEQDYYLVGLIITNIIKRDSLLL